MQFTKSKYYNQNFLGKYLYKNVREDDVIFTIHEYFEINDVKKEYFKEGFNKDGDYYNYKLVICEDYYELNCERNDDYLYLVFDKPVHIIGEYCIGIIAPEIVIKSSKNNLLSYCIGNKVIIDNNSKNYYRISFSKINDVYFYNSFVRFYSSQANNFFIFNKDLDFDYSSIFLGYHKIKLFGECVNLKKEILNNKKFQKGIIHIE